MTSPSADLLFLDPSGALGGAERVLLDLLAGLREIAPALRCAVLCFEDGPLLDEARALGARAYVLPLPPVAASLGDWSLGASGASGPTGEVTQSLFDTASAGLRLAGSGALGSAQTLAFLRALRERVRELGPALIHANGFKAQMLGTLVAGELPVVWHLHDFVGSRPITRRALRLLRNRPRLVVANSRAVAEDFKAHCAAMPVEVVHNPVDTERFSPGPADGAALDRLAGLPAAPADCLRLGLVATYARWKGHTLFLDAAARLVQRLPNQPLRFYLVGGPIYRTRASQVSLDELRAEAHRLGVEAHVGFIPFQPNPVPIYRALDVVVHASTRPEPFGLTIVEAMACARPVVVSNEGGAAELVHPLVDAMTFEPRSAESLSNALLELVTHPSLRGALSASARAAAVTSFSRRDFARQLLRLYSRESQLVRPHSLS